MSDKSLKGAFEQWEYLSASADEKIAYERRLKQIMDAAAKDKEYELRVQDAEKEGMEKGKHENKQAVAASMVEEDFDIETIVRLTGLDMETVQQIKENQE